MDRQYVDLVSTHSMSDRAIIASLLDAEGIDYYVLGESISQYLYFALPIIFRVRADQFERAMDVLEGLDINFTPYSHMDKRQKEDTNEGGH